MGGHIPEIDIFANLKKVGFSSPFDELLESYQMLMGPTRAPQEHPVYFADLMGGYNLPSLALKIAGGPPVKIGTEAGKVRNVGRVVEETHVELRRVWRENVIVVPDSPLIVMADRILSDAGIQEYLETLQALTIRMLRGEKGPAPTRLQDMSERYRPMVTSAFASVPTIDLEVGPKDNRTRISIPNKMVFVKVGMPGNLSRQTDPAPLAGMVWALDLASGGILRRKEFGLMERFIGVQSSVTDHMKTVADIIDSATGGKFYERIDIRGKELGQVYQEESHHLQVARVAAHMAGTYANGFEIALGKIGKSSATVKLDKPEFMPRDVAILLYATAIGARDMLRILAPNREQAERFRAAGRDFRTTVEKMSDELIRIAGVIARIPPGKGQNFEYAMEQPFLNEAALMVLTDAINRSNIMHNISNDAAQQNWGYSPVSHPNAMMLVMRDVYPGLFAELRGSSRPSRPR